MKIQFEGELELLKDSNLFFDLGVDRAIIGTAAFKDLNFLASMASDYPRRIWLGTDVLARSANSGVKTVETGIN